MKNKLLENAKKNIILFSNLENLLVLKGGLLSTTLMSLFIGIAGAFKHLGKGTLMLIYSCMLSFMFMFISKYCDEKLDEIRK